jgi:hypothetical protein
MLQDMVNQKLQEALKTFQDNKIKEREETQKQINEIIGTLNKYQTETEITITRDIHFNHRILYPAKLSFKIDGTMKIFQDKQKLKQATTTKDSPRNSVHR